MERQQYAETRDGVHSYAVRSLPPGFTPDVDEGRNNGGGSMTGMLEGSGSMQGSMKKGSIKSGTGSLLKKGGSKKSGASRRNSLLQPGGVDMLQPIMEDDATYRLYINLQAFAYTSDSYRQLHPKVNNFMLSKQTDVFPNAVVPSQKGFAASNGPAVIQETMLGLLKEVFLDMDIKSSFGTVDDKPTPYFCQFSSSAATPATMMAAAAIEKVKRRKEGTLSPEPPEENSTQAEPEAAAALDSTVDLSSQEPPLDADKQEALPDGDAPQGDAQVGADAPVADEGRKSPGLARMAKISTEALAIAKAEAILARNEKLAKEKAESDALRALHRDEDFYYLMAKVIENTAANMSVEASYGEFDTTRPPRQIVEAKGEGIEGEDMNNDGFLDTFPREQTE